MLDRNITSVLSSVFGRGQIASDGINYQIVCPSCRKQTGTTKRKLHVRLDDLRYHCWVCGLKGKNILYLAKKYDPSVQVGHIRPKEVVVEKEEEVITLPNNLVPVYRETSDPDIKAVRKYLERRGLSKSKIQRWRIMAAKKGPLRRYAVIPSFDSMGNLNYYVSRSIDEGGIRYKNAKTKKSSIVFNEVDIDWSSEVNLVEGVFDAIKCPENTIPILGSSMSDKSRLIKKLAKHQCPVTISLDPDMPEKAYEVAEMVRMTGCKTYIAFAPQNYDLGDLTCSAAKEVISNRLVYNPYLKIKHRIGTLRSGSVF